VQPRQQLTKIERFRDVVVGTQVKACNPRLDRVTRRQHQDRDGRSTPPELVKDGEAVTDREHDVENDRVVVRQAGFVEGALAVADHVDGVRRLAQAFGEHVRGMWLIFDKQNPHRWGRGCQHSIRRPLAQPHRS
jgi:uncharacterized membrane protein YdfJ with MMPL/SSD domain